MPVIRLTNKAYWAAIGHKMIEVQSADRQANGDWLVRVDMTQIDRLDALRGKVPRGEELSESILRVADGRGRQSRPLDKIWTRDERYRIRAAYVVPRPEGAEEQWVNPRPIF